MAKTPSLPMRKRRWFRMLERLTAVGLMMVLALLLFDWNLLRGPIERRVSESTGREFHIHGDLSVDLSMQPRIRLERVTLGNLPWADEPHMASVERAQFRVDLRKLLRHEVVLSELRLSEPRLLIERDHNGLPNWLFKHSGGRWPTIQQLTVDRGELRVRNPLTATNLVLKIASGQPTTDARHAPLLIEGRGRYVGHALWIDGRIESPLLLEDPSRPYTIDVRAQAGATHATAQGHLIGPLQLRGFDLDFGLSGPSLALLYPLMGVAVPDTPPYHLLGRLSYDDHRWQYRNFSGRVGDSDLAGDATVDTGGERPKLSADLVSRRLDFDDLGGFIGAPPQTSPGETASAEQRREAARLRASARVLPDEPFNFDKLRTMDADVKLRAHRVNAPSLPIEAMTAHLVVDGAVLRLEPLSFRVAKGEVSSRILLDARDDTLASVAEVEARGLQLPKLFPVTRMTEDSAGRIGGTVDLAGRGNSVARMLASADGEVRLSMGSGHISNLLMEYAGLDIAESLKFLLGEDRTVPIRCAFGNFGVQDGLMTARALAFDTTDTVIHGQGSINLRGERLQLRLKPQPKDHSVFTLRAPLLVGGSFKHPSFQPDYSRVTLRAVAAGALASLAPPAALLAVYETGPGEDVDCGANAPGASKPR